MDKSKIFDINTCICTKFEADVVDFILDWHTTGSQHRRWLSQFLTELLTK